MLRECRGQATDACTRTGVDKIRPSWSAEWFRQSWLAFWVTPLKTSRKCYPAVKVNVKRRREIGRWWVTLKLAQKFPSSAEEGSFGPLDAHKYTTHNLCFFSNGGEANAVHARTDGTGTSAGARSRMCQHRAFGR